SLRGADTRPAWTQQSSDIGAQFAPFCFSWAMHMSCLDNYANDLDSLPRRRGSRLCACLPHSARRRKLPTRRRWRNTCQMLGTQLLSFSQAPQLNLLVPADRIWGVGDDHSQGMVT